MLTTVIYIFNGLYVYITVGDAAWITSPANLSLDDGVVKDICLSLVVVYFAISVLVDGTVFVRNLQSSFQRETTLPQHSDRTKERLKEKENGFDSDIQDAQTTNGVGHQDADKEVLYDKGPASGTARDSRQLERVMSWFMWSSGTMVFVSLTTASIGNYNDLLGIIAALVASQTSITWPCFFYFWMHERISVRHEDCYYHGSGTSPCRCSRRRILLSPRVWLACIGFLIGVGGIWSNVIDLVGRRTTRAAPGWFDCRNSPFEYVPRVNADQGSDLIPAKG